MTRTCCLYPSPKYIAVRARATNFVVTFVLLTDNARVKIVSKILRERERERERELIMFGCLWDCHIR